MVSELDSRATLIRADSAPSESSRRASSWTLPPDLLAEAVGRLRSSALLYAVAYFLAAFVPALAFPEERVRLAANPAQWIPRVLSIAVALTLAWLASRRGISARLKLYAALGFEVLGSFGIAVVEYQHITAPIGQGGAGPVGFGLWGGWTPGAISTPSAVWPTGCSPGPWCSRAPPLWKPSSCRCMASPSLPPIVPSLPSRPSSSPSCWTVSPRIPPVRILEEAVR